MAAKFPVVCAIDFGTTFSGYSFAFTNKPKEIFTRNDWGQEAGIQGGSKTPTSLLLSSDKEYKIGYDAMVKYYDDPKGRYFDRFKMVLHNASEKLSVDATINDHSGRPLSALTVFAEVIKVLKSSFIRQVNDMFAGTINVHQVLWVITVPAIWTSGAKQFMKQAAAQAGLVSNAGSAQLKIALEPEAASIHCRYLNVLGPSSKSGPGEMPVGTKYMILDAGGGTLDITVHEVLANKQLAETYSVGGTSAGGMLIDNDFVKLMDKMFEKPFMAELKKKSPPAFVDFLIKFESPKKAFGPNSRDFRIGIPAGVTDFYKDATGSEFRDSINDDFRKCGVKYNAGILFIPQQVMMKVYEPTLSKIISHVADLFRKPELKNVKTILMVGGLSCSDVLHARMTEKFGKSCAIIRPENASAAVVMGATRLGLNPEAIAK